MRAEGPGRPSAHPRRGDNQRRKLHRILWRRQHQSPPSRQRPPRRHMARRHSVPRHQTNQGHARHQRIRQDASLQFIRPLPVWRRPLTGRTSNVASMEKLRPDHHDASPRQSGAHAADSLCRAGQADRGPEDAGRLRPGRDPRLPAGARAAGCLVDLARTGGRADGGADHGGGGTVTPARPVTADLDPRSEARSKLKLGINPDLAAMMQARIRAGGKAVTTAMLEVGACRKSGWRGQITGAGRGTRLGNSIRRATYPKGSESLNAAVPVWSKAPGSSARTTRGR